MTAVIREGNFYVNLYGIAIHRKAAHNGVLIENKA